VAFLRSLERVCQSGVCRSRATVELLNLCNAPMGHYCQRHGNEKLRLLEVKEMHRNETSLLAQLDDQRMRLRLTEIEWHAVLEDTGLRMPEEADPAALEALLAELRKMGPAK